MGALLEQPEERNTKCFGEEHLAPQTSPVGQRCGIFDTDVGEAVILAGALPVPSDPSCVLSWRCHPAHAPTLPRSCEKGNFPVVRQADASQKSRPGLKVISSATPELHDPGHVTFSTLFSYL